MQRYATILCTAAGKTAAQRLACGLVERKLAACLQCLPIESVYVWKGEIQHDAEVLLLIKTRRSCFEAIQSFVREHHSYDVPELICLDIVEGAGDYLEWLGANTLPTVGE